METVFSLIQEIDVSILLWIQENVRNSAADMIMVIFTTMGNAGILWIVVSGIMLCFPRWRRIGFFALISLLVCYCLNDVILKSLVMRPRPVEAIEGLKVMVPLLSSSSFASGHTVSAFAAVNTYRRKTGRGASVALFLLAIVMGVSRLYVGMHYPSDVLVGAVIGLLGSQAVWSFGQYLLGQWRRKKTEPEIP